MAANLTPIIGDVDLIRGELSRKSLQEFIKTCWHVVEPTTPYVHNWHIDCVCDHLANLDQIGNLLISICPGGMKSLLCDVFFPCWKWIHDPSLRFLFASYSLSLAERDSIKCRRLIASPLYQKCFGGLFQITSEQDTKRHFENDKTGYRQSISTGSQTKGLKGNVICIDDPLNSSDANSEIKKQECRDWFADSFFDRLCDFKKDCRIVIGQRIAKDDLHAYILEHYGSEWTHICLPWEYRPTTFVSPIGWSDPRKEEGEPLWPERFPDSAIKQLKRKSRTWSCQWQQNPIDSENALFKAEEFRYYQETETAYQLGERKIAKADCWRLMAVDLAISLDKRADYSVIMVADVARTGEIILVHVLRDRIGGTKIIPTLKAMNDTHRPAYILIAFQRMVLDQARAEGLAVRGIRPDGDKESRTLPLQVRFEASQVWFPQDRPWLPILERELTEFPNGAHDDTVDALAYVAYESGRRSRQRPERTEEPKQETPEERMAKGLVAGLR